MDALPVDSSALDGMDIPIAAPAASKIYFIIVHLLLSSAALSFQERARLRHYDEMVK
ncbi:hypothetical protein GCM10011503_10510 [Henriciella pelagia]|uniref:Uncharacterized protein n=1 Tax=Henriciella pelagia TaxID=1977912 RepID=A0ABQ1J9Y1_9PROT|nr:hypothetical protein GCM10011503_10510 [Henriciella pelagia]